MVCRARRGATAQTFQSSSFNFSENCFFVCPINQRACPSGRFLFSFGFSPRFLSPYVSIHERALFSFFRAPGPRSEHRHIYCTTSNSSIGASLYPRVLKLGPILAQGPREYWPKFGENWPIPGPINGPNNITLQPCARSGSGHSVANKIV